MQLWVGLGNPGPDYAMNRHNVGFMVADAIAEVHDFSAPAKKFQGWLQEGRIGGDKILLLKPATYMNESGRAVRAAAAHSTSARMWGLSPLPTSRTRSRRDTGSFLQARGFDNSFEILRIKSLMIAGGASAGPRGHRVR